MPKVSIGDKVRITNAPSDVVDMGFLLGFGDLNGQTAIVVSGDDLEGNGASADALYVTLDEHPDAGRVGLLPDEVEVVEFDSLAEDAA